MNPDPRAHLQRVKEIFVRVAESPPAARTALLGALSEGDAGLRRDVEQLLACGENPHAVLDRPASAAMRYRPGDVLAGRYRLTAFLASGGMGDVYAAVDEQDGRPVALKCIRRFGNLEGKAEARLRREVKMAGEIHHPNVCAMYGLEEDHGEKFSVMELLKGETLAACLLRERALPANKALPIVRQVLAGLEAAHSAGIVHRDLKPSNIMLDGERAVIIDFGLAAAAPGHELDDPSLTASGAVIGTLAYIAPEQLAGEECGPPADLYSLGVLLFEVLTAVKPHEAKSPFQLAAQKADDSGIRSALQDHGVPAVWAEAITRCLKARPEDRVHSAAAVRAILERGKPTLWFQWESRKWWVAVPAAAVLLALGIWAAWRFAGRDYQPSAKAGVLYAKGQAALVGAAPVGGMQLLERAVHADGHFIIARAALAGAYMEVDQPDQAREAVLQASSEADSRWLLGREERRVLEAARAVVVRKFARAADLYAKVAASSCGVERHYALLAQARMQEQNGQFDEARATVEMVLREDPENTTARVRLAALMCRKREYTAAERAFQRAQATLEKAGNQEGLCDLLIVRQAVLRTQTPEEQHRTIALVKELAGRTGNRYHALAAQFQTAMLAQRGREYERAIAILEEGSAQALKEGMPVLAARAMGDLGYGFLYLKRPKQAVPILKEALTMAQRAGSQGVEANVRLQLAEALGFEGQERGALEIMEPAVRWMRRNGSEESLPLILIKWGTALNGSTRYEENLNAFLEALEIATRNGNEMYQGISLQRLGAFFQTRDLKKSADYCRRAVALAPRTGLTVAYFGAAETYLAMGDYARGMAVTEEGERDVSRRYGPGVDRDVFLKRSVYTRARHALYQGDCGTAYRILRRSLSEEESLLRVARACSGEVSARQVKRDLLWFEQLLSRFHEGQHYGAAARAADAGFAAVYIRDWESAKKFAERGLQAAVAGQHALWELYNLLVLRAAHRGRNQRAQADQVGRRVLETAAKLGYQPPERFGGREDLLRLWR